ncbi:MAG: hypothetical protein ABIJ97_17560 [Bacteroidota bacterium]
MKKRVIIENIKKLENRVQQLEFDLNTLLGGDIKEIEQLKKTKKTINDICRSWWIGEREINIESALNKKYKI